MTASLHRPAGTDLLTFNTKYLDYAETRFVDGVYREKKNLCKKLIDVFGSEFLVEQMTPESVLTFLDTHSVSNNVFNRHRKNLLAMWRFGQDILDIKTNPIAKIKKRRHDRKPQYVPPIEDILRVIAVTKREERVFLDAYLQTGARRSEIFRWTWSEDINFEKRTVRLGTRKTRDASMKYDLLPMTSDLYASLMWWYKKRTDKSNDFVFPAPSGKAYKYRRRFLAQLCKRAKVKEFGYHALRRYVASILADKHKISAKTIQAILRHSNVQTTEKYICNLSNDLSATMELLAGKNKKTHKKTHKTKEASGDNR
jgi:integrase